MNKQLEHALRTLRGIRARFETGKSYVGSGEGRSTSIHVALGTKDLLWITAVIEALEEATTTSRRSA